MLPVHILPKRNRFVSRHVPSQKSVHDERVYNYGWLRAGSQQILREVTKGKVKQPDGSKSCYVNWTAVKQAKLLQSIGAVKKRCGDGAYWVFPPLEEARKKFMEVYPGFEPFSENNEGNQWVEIFPASKE